MYFNFQFTIEFFVHNKLRCYEAFWPSSGMSPVYLAPGQGSYLLSLPSSVYQNPESWHPSARGGNLGWPPKPVKRRYKHTHNPSFFVNGTYCYSTTYTRLLIVSIPAVIFLRFLHQFRLFWRRSLRDLTHMYPDAWGRERWIRHRESRRQTSIRTPKVFLTNLLSSLYMDTHESWACRNKIWQVVITPGRRDAVSVWM